MGKNAASLPADPRPAPSSTAPAGSSARTAAAARAAAASSARPGTSEPPSSASSTSTLHIGWCALCQWCERAPFSVISAHLAACRERHQAMLAEREEARRKEEIRRRAVHAATKKRH